MIGKLASGLIIMIILGVSLYLSPLRGNTVAVVGAFASLSAAIIVLLATVEIEIISVEEEDVGVDVDMDKTSLKETHASEILSDTVGPLDFSHTNMYPRKTSEFKIDVYSSENRITLSSHYAPRRAHLVERPLEKRQAKR